MSHFPHPDTVFDIIRDVALRVVEPRFQTLKEGDIRSKSSPSDLVTIADTQAEAELERFLPALVPGSVALGEEAISRGEHSEDRLLDRSGTYWVIDPVDGTHNFAHGIPVFGTMVSLVHNGECVQAYIYDIPGKRAVFAEKGGGAHINGVKMSVSPSNKPVNEVKGYINTRFLPEKIKSHLSSLSGQLGDTTAHFCCAFEYAGLVSGESSFALYTRMKPWDHLAGALILTEAGGFIRKWDKSTYTPQDQKGGLLAASDEALWEGVRSLLLLTDL